MAKVECVLDVGAKLGEGIIWDEREQALYWVDIDGKALHRFDPASGDDRAWSLPTEIGCFLLREQGGAVLAMRDGFWTFDFETGLRQPITDPETHLPDSRFNDGTADPRGRLFAGTMPMGDRKPVAAFYLLDTDLSCRRMFDGLTVCNGSAFSPDGRTLYFSDSQADVRTIWACDYDADSGTARNRRVFVDTHGLAGRPDGGTVDAEGCYWMAGVSGWQIVRFTPAGKVDMEIDMPVEKPTKIAFGGSGCDTLYVTSIGKGGITEGTEDRQPHAGAIFALRVPGVTGLPMLRFKG